MNKYLPSVQSKDKTLDRSGAFLIDRGGCGIGLSIAGSICENCGGSIEALWRDGVIPFICQLY